MQVTLIAIEDGALERAPIGLERRLELSKIRERMETIQPE